MGDLTPRGAVKENTRMTEGTALFRDMVRIRAFELAAKAAKAKGEVPGTLHLYIGEEAIAAGVCAHLKRDDFITSTHRGHGHAIAKGADVSAMMCELFGRATGTCKGKGGSMHIADFSVGMLGANGVVGGGIGIAIGAAYAARLQDRQTVSVCFFGDGGINRGAFLEGLNWARVFELPVLFVCEDNGFAAYTRSDRMTAGSGALARAESIGVPGLAVDGNDAFAVYDAAAELIAGCRAGRGPRFLYAKTYRLEGHTIADKTPYRSDEEVEIHRGQDPLRRLARQLMAWGLREPDIDKVYEEARTEMAKATQVAHEAPWPSESDALSDVQILGAPK
jgi:acetoin:2,6-dichlorophenolindophenol oxidoreductase subunit alpha